MFAFPTIVILGLGTLIFLQLKSRTGGIDPQEVARLRADADHKTEEIGQLKSEIAKERSDKDELAGKGKQLYTSYKDLEADQKAVTHERDALHKRVAEYEAKEENRRKEFEDQVSQLHSAKKSLAEERARVIKEDEERAERELTERDRKWAEHEESVVAQFSSLCKKPQYAFTLYGNTNLPEGFDGSFKPDVLIEFLGQYIIFDAKVSRSENFQNYIATQVKSTAKKAKSRSDIYPSIFLVVPTEAIAELKEVVHYEGGFTFYIISPEAVAPVLASLKRITEYELAEQFDPQEREDIVNLITKYDYHINERNTFDVLMARRGGEVLKDAEKLYPKITKEVGIKKEKMRLPNFKPSEIKRLINSVAAREEAVADLTAPKAAIDM